mmetsp:Transcript_3114/g.8937  ORF Transcript_3114/g.8937 Transcript_3114/m.8937 type:complete len:212 (-) Transcript_3114:582-1217(-)
MPKVGIMKNMNGNAIKLYNTLVLNATARPAGESTYCSNMTRVMPPNPSLEGEPAAVAMFAKSKNAIQAPIETLTTRQAKSTHNNFRTRRPPAVLQQPPSLWCGITTVSLLLSEPSRSKSLTSSISECCSRLPVWLLVLGTHINANQQKKPLERMSRKWSHVGMNMPGPSWVQLWRSPGLMHIVYMANAYTNKRMPPDWNCVPLNVRMKSMI